MGVEDIVCQERKEPCVINVGENVVKKKCGALCKEIRDVGVPGYVREKTTSIKSEITRFSVFPIFFALLKE